MTNEYTRRDLSLSMLEGNVYALLLAMPLALVCIILFRSLWGSAAFFAGLKTFMHPLIVLPSLILGTVIHEIIHGISWVYFGKIPREAMKYGVQWKTVTPYAHCTEPMDVTAYRIGGAMPGIVLGLLPLLIGLVLGLGPIFVFGLLFTVAAGGDAAILWSLRNVARGRLVEDHPTRGGCYVLEPQDSS